MPAAVYDTQVAAAFAGYSLQTGYGALVQSVLGVRLSKEEGFADWSRESIQLSDAKIRGLPGAINLQSSRVDQPAQRVEYH